MHLATYLRSLYTFLWWNVIMIFIPPCTFFCWKLDNVAQEQENSQAVIIGVSVPIVIVGSVVLILIVVIVVYFSSRQYKIHKDLKVYTISSFPTTGPKHLPIALPLIFTSATTVSFCTCRVMVLRGNRLIYGRRAMLQFPTSPQAWWRERKWW